MPNVVCWLWDDPGYRWNTRFRYGPDHVNRLYRAAQRHYPVPHRFICVTDHEEGFDPGVELVPIWPDPHGLGGCYRRLRAFAPDMKDVLGERFVWMDVDCVVTGDLTPLFERTEDFVIWRNGVGPTPYCGSMVMMTAGARSEVWDDFDPHQSRKAGQRLGYVGTDQAWIAARLGPDEAVWTPDDGVLSRVHAGVSTSLPGRLRRRSRAANGSLPDHARVVFFHGPVDPSLAGLQERHPWIGENWR